MRTLILATASAIALGIAGASPLYAADPASGTAPGASSATQAPSSDTAPSASSPTGTTMQPATPSTSGDNQWSHHSSMNSGNRFNNAETASGSQSSMDWPRVNRSDVEQIQQKLQQQGLYHGKIDGLVGPGTQQALRSYQRQNGLPVTATLDPQTLNSLNGAGTGVGSSMPPASSNGEMTPSTNAGSSRAATPSAPANPKY